MKVAPASCPLCAAPARPERVSDKVRNWDCPRCGMFLISRDAELFLAVRQLSAAEREQVSARVRAEFGAAKAPVVVFAERLRSWIGDAAQPVAPSA